MSAKKKQQPQPSGADPGRPSASPADGGQAASKALRKNWVKIPDDPVANAAWYLIGGESRKYQDRPGWWDDLLELAVHQPEQAEDVLRFAGDILRSGLQCLERWAAATHAPKVKFRSEQILAEIIFSLEMSGLVRPKTTPAEIGQAFAARRMELQKASAKRSKFYAVNSFPAHLLNVASEWFAEAWDSYPQVPKGRKLDSAHTGIYRLVQFWRPQFRKRESTDEEYAGIQPEYVFRGLCRTAGLDEAIFDRALAPLAKELWPAFAREHMDRACLKMRKLSEAKKPKSKLDSFETWETEIRGAHLRSMATWRLVTGEGAAISLRRGKPSPPND